MLWNRCALCAVVAAILFMFCSLEFWDTLNFENCEIRYPELPQTPFDKKLFNIERMPLTQSGCLTSKFLRQTKYSGEGLPVNLGVIQLTALSEMSEDSLRSFYAEYYDWIETYTREGGILLLKNFTRAMTDREHLSSSVGNVDFQTNELPPFFVPISVHSHIIPHPILIQCLEQTPSQRLGHTVFYNLPKALEMLTQADRDDIKKFLQNGYNVPFLIAPRDFISCEFHGCSENQVKVTNTMVDPADLSKGFGMIPAVWFRGGGYVMHMLQAGTYGIPNNFWRTIFGGIMMRAIMAILSNAQSAINQPFETRLYDALWLNSVGIRLTPGDMVISNSWVTPHARLASNEGKKLRTVEFFPCDSIDGRTNCGSKFDFEDLEALARQKMDYQQGLNSAKWMNHLTKAFRAFFTTFPVSTFLY